MSLDANASTPQGVAPALPPASASDDAPASLLAMVQTLWGEVRGLAHDQLELLSLEAQLAGQALARLLMLGAAMGILLGGAWLCLLLASGLWLWEQGLRASSIVLIALAINMIALIALGLAMRRARQAMGFSRSLHSLQSQAQSIPTPETVAPS